MLRSVAASYRRAITVHPFLTPILKGYDLRLSFQTPHLSITSFPAIELPPFTLITGLNGSGKSHLLGGIEAGAVKVEGLAQNGQKTRFDWNTLVPADVGLQDGIANVTQRAQFFDTLEGYRKPLREELLELFGADEIPEICRRFPNRVFDYQKEELAKPIAGDLSKVSQLYAVLAKADQELTRIGKSQLGRQAQWGALVRTATAMNCSPFSFNRAEIEEGDALGWGNTGVFQNALGEMFVAYRNMRLANDLRQNRELKGEQNVEALTDLEFLERYGVPPWDFANKAFAKIGIDFTIDSPNRYAYAPYQPRLHKKSTNVDVAFSSLSSGEKILMSLALCLYRALDKRQNTSFPALLLLDEIDAPLHPGMTRSYLEVIDNILVKESGVNVIATTHSPSTVALAPAESLFVMLSNPPRLERASKASALNILTEGVPTLSVSYEGRRQVFVEGDADAKIYGLLYQTLKTKLKFETSLDCIKTGVRSNKDRSSVNSGCAVVKSLVDQLRASGNKQIFGIVDWDGCNNPSDGLIVLAHGSRHSLENVILDPLLIAALICRECPELKSLIGLSENETWLEFVAADISKLQQVVSAIGLSLLGAAISLVEVEYFGGFSLQVDERLLEMRGHDLQALVLQKFPPLKKFTAQSDGLLIHISKVIAAEKPDYLPVTLVDAFQKILGEQIN